MIKPENELAVIEINSKQHLVQKGDTLKVDTITEETSVDVLLHQDKDLSVGEPVLEGFGIKLEIIENKKDKKVITSRFKSKSKYRRNRSHRQPISVVKVIDFGKGIKTSIKASKN